MEGRELPRYRSLALPQLHQIPQLRDLDPDRRLVLEAVSAVLPFRVNRYVLDELINWDDIPADPIFQLTFPQAGMLAPQDLRRMVDLVRNRAGKDEIAAAARKIRMRMNPHPAGQMELNVPEFDGRRLPGVQHKYRETVLFFPAGGQTCHAYCTYCFRWPQFVGAGNLRFATSDVAPLTRYLRSHPEVTDVLITGGDPLIMSSRALRRRIEPLLADDLKTVANIRIGTKALSYWPYRFIRDRDAEDLLRLFEDVRASGRQLALMAHFSHPRELGTAAVQSALRRVLATGAVVRSQAPLVHRVNDDPDVWASMWRQQVRLGVVPYYMFMERDTGPRHYFEVRIARALRIFSAASSQISGLARTVRGPVMSANPGKVLVDGVATVDGERVFVLKMIQGRDPAWVNRVFFASFDPNATWIDQLRSVPKERRFFFEPAIRNMQKGTWRPPWQADAEVPESLVSTDAG